MILRKYQVISNLVSMGDCLTIDSWRTVKMTEDLAIVIGLVTLMIFGGYMALMGVGLIIQDMRENETTN